MISFKYYRYVGFNDHVSDDDDNDDDDDNLDVSDVKKKPSFGPRVSEGYCPSSGRLKLRERPRSRVPEISRLS